MTAAYSKEPGETLGRNRGIDNVAAQKRCYVVVLSDMNINNLWLGVTDRPFYRIITG